MNNIWLPYDSGKFKDSPWSKILHCGKKHERIVVIALSYLPKEVFHKLKDNLAIYSTAGRDACRVARAISKEREIIILSDHILPKNTARFENWDVRYFIYVVLHEIAHVFKKHRSPMLDKLTESEIQAQENEADKIALKWFNEFVKSSNNAHLKQITVEEVKQAKRKMQKQMKILYEETNDLQ